MIILCEILLFCFLIFFVFLMVGLTIYINSVLEKLFTNVWQNDFWNPVVWIPLLMDFHFETLVNNIGGFIHT